MTDYLFLMHDDLPPGSSAAPGTWDAYLHRLRGSEDFQGGSSIGAGGCFARAGEATQAVTPLVGFLRIGAASLAAAQQWLVGNPHYEAGGTVEIRELPRD